MFSVLFLFSGRRGVAPMVGGMMLTNEWNFHLPLPGDGAAITDVSVAGLRYRTLALARWRYGIPNQGIWLRVFWLGY